MNIKDKCTAASTCRNIRENFADPAAEFSMIPFWFWNDSLDEETIRCQLEEMLVKKIKAVCIHPMPDSFRKEDFIAGMTDEYLGKRFMECVRYVVVKARELGMKIWLYDEGGWPSGLALGQVVRSNSNFSQQTLHCDPKTGELSVVKNDARTDLLNAAVTKSFIELTYEKYKTAVGEFFGDTVTGIFTDEPNIAGHVGSSSIPWTVGLPEFFRNVKGYDLIPFVRALFKYPCGLDEEKIKEIRYDFCDVVSRLFAKSYFDPIGKWCKENNLRLVGHLDRDHALLEHLSGGYHLPRLLQYYDVPGIDCIWRQISPGKPRADFPKFASSVAHTRSRRFVLSESFGAYGLGLTFTRMKSLVDQQFVRGINLLVPHAFHYSCRGPRAFGVNSNLFLADPRWSFFKEFAQYVSRLSFLMSSGKSSANVGLYYPIGSLWQESLASPSAQKIADGFEEISDCLMRQHVEFDYIDDDAMLSETSDIREGVFHIGEGAYQFVIFPADIIPQADILASMDKFVRSGGAIVFVGRRALNRMADNGMDKGGDLKTFIKGMAEHRGDEVMIEKWGKGKVVFADDVHMLFDHVESIPKSVHFMRQNAYITVCRRVAEDCTIFLLANESHSEQKAVVDFQCEGVPIVAELEKGEFSAIDTVDVGAYEIFLPPYGSKVILFDKRNNTCQSPQSSRCMFLPQRICPEVWHCRITRQYSFKAGELTAVPLDYELAPKSALTPWLRDFADSFSGTIEYASSIIIPEHRKKQTLLLDLGQGVKDQMFRVWINEKFAGSVVWQPFELDISRFIRTGENRIRVAVSNTLGNLVQSPTLRNDLEKLGWYNVYMKKISRLCKEHMP